jgi:hypothetical protein
MKYWEIIADNLSKAGWSWGCLSAIDRDGGTIWIVDAHRDDGKRFVAHGADEKLTAFWRLESPLIRTRRDVGQWPTSLVGRHTTFFLDRVLEFLSTSASLNGSESGGGLSPARFFALPDPQSQK